MCPRCESVALVARPGAQITCKRCRRIVRMKRAPHPLGCFCDDCTVAAGRVHAEADAACGRVWSCQCAACKRAREISARRAFAKLEGTQQRLAKVRGRAGQPGATSAHAGRMIKEMKNEH